jgi:hypothetical protein
MDGVVDTGRGLIGALIVHGANMILPVEAGRVGAWVRRRAITPDDKADDKADEEEETVDELCG